jgi:hypothetical protein
MAIRPCIAGALYVLFLVACADAASEGRDTSSAETTLGSSAPPPAAPSTSRTVHVTSTSPPEARLALIASGVNPVHGSTIGHFARLLDRLEPRCEESREQIADLTVEAREGLRLREGIEVGLMAILVNINNDIPAEAAGSRVRCSEVAARGHKNDQ